MTQKSQILIKIEGITGDSKVKQHEGWIEALSFTFGMGLGIYAPDENTGVRQVSRPSVSEITFTKWMDNASLALTKHFVSKKASEVLIHIFDTEKQQNLFEYKLSETYLSGYSLSSTSQSQETISLNYGSISIKQFSDQSELRFKTSTGEIL